MSPPLLSCRCGSLTKTLQAIRDIFVFDPEDEADDWWVHWGLVQERSERILPGMSALSILDPVIFVDFAPFSFSAPNTLAQRIIGALFTVFDGHATYRDYCLIVRTSLRAVSDCFREQESH